MSRKPFVRTRFLDAKNDMRNRKLDDTNKKIGFLYVEDITDKEFWQKIATKHRVMVFQNNASFFMAGKGNLLYYTNEGETETLLDKCSHTLLIAIDSDFDVLCPNAIDKNWIHHKNKNFILQTYAHGRENITFSPYCRLYQILENKFKLYIDNHENKILNIFEELSKIWFEPYQKFLFLHNQKNASFTHDDWIKAISFQNQESKTIALNQDFSAYQNRISDLNQQLNQYIENQHNFMMFCEHLAKNDFSQHHVWPFIRCHDFEEKIVMPIIQEICGHRIKTEISFIESSYSNDEARDRKEQCGNYFKKVNGIQTVLHHYFYDVYFPNHQHQDYFLQKIVTDYQRVIA